MASLYEKYENILDTNPNARRMLNVIQAAEGTNRYKDPYRVGFGGTYIGDLSKHPGTSLRRSFVQTDGTTNTSTAAGASQWMPNTWNPLAKKLGINDFSPRSQDIATLAKIDERGGLQAGLSGDVDKFAYKVRQEWASFPGAGYKQHTRSQEQIRKYWEQNGGTAPEGGYKNYIEGGKTANNSSANISSSVVNSQQSPFISEIFQDNYQSNKEQGLFQTSWLGASYAQQSDPNNYQSRGTNPMQLPQLLT